MGIIHLGLRGRLAAWLTSPGLKCPEMLAHNVPGFDVAWIGRSALHCRLHHIWRVKLEIRFDHRPDRVIELGEIILFPAVKIRVPVPGRMPAGALCAKHEEI